MKRQTDRNKETKKEDSELIDLQRIWYTTEHNTILSTDTFINPETQKYFYLAYLAREASKFRIGYFSSSCAKTVENRIKQTFVITISKKRTSLW